MGPDRFGQISTRMRLGRTPKGSCDTQLLRRVLRRVLKTAFEKTLRRVHRSYLEVGLRRKDGVLRSVLRRGSRRGSKKGLPRRHLEGGNTPF